MMGDLKQTARTVIAYGGRPLAERRLKQTLAAAPRPLRIEIGGAGQRDGWITTDVTWNARHYLDATSPWPVEAGAVEYVFADNVVEHLTLEQNRRMFRCARATMSLGGTIRLATPDVEEIARLYLHGQSSDVERSLAWHRRAGRTAPYAVDLVRLTFVTFGHEKGYLFDLASLGTELVAAGFGNVRRAKTSQSDDSNLAGLESRTDEEADTQLVVEADAV